MASPRDLLLTLVIKARDDASAVAGRISAAYTALKALLISFLGIKVFGGLVDEAAQFEAQLDAIATKGSYTAQEMAVVSEKVSQVARDFKITGTEAGQAAEVLAAAGLSSVDAMAALPPVLALAKNEGIGFEQSANLISNSVAVMGLSFQDAARVADVLTQGANISKTSAVALGAALVEAGAGATAAGLDLEQTVAILAALAKNGIEGEKAGTALKNVFAQLADPASKARQELANIGITTGNAGAALTQLANVPLPLAQKAINAFGLDAGPALRAYLKEGGAGIQGFLDQLQGIEGVAYDTSKSLSDNLLGALDGLSSIWGEVSRRFAEPLLTPLKEQADALSASLKSFVDSGVLPALATGFADAFVGGLNAVRNFVGAIDLIPVAVAFERVKTAAVSASNTLGSLLPSAASAGAAAGSTLATVMEHLTELIGAGLAAAGAKAVQTLAAVGASTYQWVTAQIAAREAARDQALVMEAQRQEAIRLAQAQVAGATAALNKAVAERAHAAAVLSALEANLGYGASEADVAAARAANVVAGNAAIAANERLVAADAALVAANTAAAESTTLLSRAMTFLAGPGGLILAAVGAFAYLLLATDKQKPSTDALAKSTDEYAKALKGQTEWQIKAANVDLSKQITAQQKLIEQAAEQAKWAKLGLIDVDLLIQGEDERVRVQDRLAIAMAALETEQQKLKGLEERRALSLQELDARQNGVADAIKATEARMAPYQAALDAANKAHAEAVAKLNELAPGMKGFGAAVNAVQTANESITLAQARYNAELQNLIRGLPEAADQSRKLAIQQTLLSQQLAAQAEQAQAAAEADDALASAAAKTAAAQIEALKAERELALARGDAVTAGRLAAQIADAETKAAHDNAAALQAAAVAARAALEAKQKAADAASDHTAKTLQEIAVLKEEVAQKETGAQIALLRAQSLDAETAGIQRQLESMRTNAQAALALATAKGDEKGAREANISVMQAELTQAKFVQVARETEILAIQEQRTKIIELAGGVEHLTDQQKIEVAQLDKVILAKQRDIDTSILKIQKQQLEIDQAQRMAGPIGELIRLYEKKTVAAEHELSAIQAAFANKQRDLDLEIKQAEAKGNTALASQLKVEKAQLEAEQAAAIAAATVRQTDAEIGLLEAKKLNVLASEKSVEAKAKEIEEIDALIAKQREQAEAARDAARSAQAEADAAKQAIAATNDQTVATDRATVATQQFGTAAEAISGTLGGWGQRLMRLSDAAYNAFLSERGAVVGMRETASAADQADAALDALGQTLSSSLGTGFAREMNNLAIQAQEIEARFWGQAAAAQRLTEQLQAMAEDGTVNMAALANATRGVSGEFDLLDQQRLSNLQSAIDAANAKLREMQAEAEDARAEIARLNAEIAAEQGDTEKAALLKQQLDYQRALADIEAKRAQAEAEGNRELVALYDEQARKLGELNTLKEKNIKADADAAEAAKRTADQVEKVSKTTADYADDTERLAGAMERLSKVDMSGLSGQFAGLHQDVAALRDAL